MSDPINPQHYRDVQINGVPIQPIDVIEALDLDFSLGTALKHAWRAGFKGPVIEDLGKCQWYLDRWTARLGAKSADHEFLAGLLREFVRSFVPSGARSTDKMIELLAQMNATDFVLEYVAKEVPR